MRRGGRKRKNGDERNVEAGSILTRKLNNEKYDEEKRRQEVQK